MTAGMGLFCLCGDRCEAYGPNGIVALPAEFEAQHDALVVIDTDDAAIQVLRLAGDPRHGPALAARHMRLQGVMEGEVKVVVHASHKRGAEYDLLFTAYPAARFAILLTWTAAQPHVVAAVPVAALLWACLERGQGVVYRSGPRFTFIANTGGTPVHFSTQAFSEEVADLVATAGVLGDGILAQFEQLGGAGGLAGLTRVSWVSRVGAGQGADDVDMSVVARLEERLQMPVRPVVHESTGAPGLRQGLGFLARRYSPAMAICTPAQRAALMAHHHLRTAALVGAAAAAIAVAAAAGFALSAMGHRAEAARTATEALAVEARTAQRAPEERMPEQFDETRALVERLANFSDGPDLTRILGALRAAGSSGVRVLRVYTVTPEPVAARQAPGVAVPVERPRIQIDATVDPSPGRGTSDALSDFVSLIRSQGFEVNEVDGQARGGASVGRTLFSYQLVARESNGRAGAAK